MDWMQAENSNASHLWSAAATFWERLVVAARHVVQTHNAVPETAYIATCDPGQYPDAMLVIRDHKARYGTFDTRTSVAIQIDDKKTKITARYQDGTEIELPFALDDSGKHACLVSGTVKLNEEAASELFLRPVLKPDS